MKEASSSEAMTRLGGLPAEIRDADFALIARTTVAGVSNALLAAGGPDEAGYVSVTLPNGATVGTPMSLAEAAGAALKAMCYVLRALPAVSAYLTADEQPFIQSCVSPIVEAYETYGDGGFPTGTRISLTPGSGCRLDATLGIDIAIDILPVRISRSASDKVATLSLHLGHTRTLSVVVAPGTIVTLSPATELAAVTLETGVAIIDDMMRLRDAGRVTEVASILGGITVDDMVRHVADHPAASVIIGYGFLRTEEPERMFAPFEATAQRLPNLPDAAVLIGEVTARMGRHEEAVQHFVRATEIGLPAFSYGMNYLIDRLRSYDPQSGGPITDSYLGAQVVAALARVQDYAPAMLHGAVLTTYMLE